MASSSYFAQDYACIEPSSTFCSVFPTSLYLQPPDESSTYMYNGSKTSPPPPPPHAVDQKSKHVSSTYNDRQHKPTPIPPIYYFHAQLVRAIKSNRVSEVNRLLGHPRFGRTSPLLPVPQMAFREFWGSAYSLAAHIGQTEVVRVFCRRGIHQHLGGFPYEYLSPLQAAIRAGHADTVRLLLADRGPSPLSPSIWKDGPRLFIQAVASGDAEIVKLLIDAEAAGARREDDSAHPRLPLPLLEDDAAVRVGLPLQLAAFMGYPDVVALLVSRGADPHARGYWGLTALEIAREEGNTEVAGVLERAMNV